MKEKKKENKIWSHFGFDACAFSVFIALLSTSIVQYTSRVGCIDFNPRSSITTTSIVKDNTTSVFESDAASMSSVNALGTAVWLLSKCRHNETHSQCQTLSNMDGNKRDISNSMGLKKTGVEMFSFKYIRQRMLTRKKRKSRKQDVDSVNTHTKIEFELHVCDSVKY